MTATAIEYRAQARGHLTTDQQRSLEDLIDGTSLPGLLLALSEICYGKSVHVAENWQDTNLAKAWDKAGDSLIAMYNRLDARL